jgi:hypothetical protein
MLHSHYATTIQRYQLAVNFDGETHFANKNRSTRFTSLREQIYGVVEFHIKFSSE